MGRYVRLSAPERRLSNACFSLLIQISKTRYESSTIMPGVGDMTFTVVDRRILGDILPPISARLFYGQYESCIKCEYARPKSCIVSLYVMISENTDDSERACISNVSSANNTSKVS